MSPRQRRTQRALVLVSAAVLSTAMLAPASASAAELVAVSTSTTVGQSTTTAGTVIITATAKALRPARQNGSANLTVIYDCTVVAAPALSAQVTSCQITSDTGRTYNDVGDSTAGEVAVAAGTVTLPASNSARICASGAGQMVLNGSRQVATAPCAIISLAL